MGPQSEIILDGRTKDGTWVVVDEDEDIPLYDKDHFAVAINGERVEVDHVSRLRDGGTTTIHLADRNYILFPRKIGNPDRTPRYNGKPVT